MTGHARDHHRMAVSGQLAGEIIVVQPMLIKEIGNGGVTIETQTPLQLDSLHDLRLALGSTSVVVKGRVAHSEISDVDQEIVTYRTGLEFVEPSDHVTDSIAKFLDAMANGADRA